MGRLALYVVRSLALSALIMLALQSASSADSTIQPANTIPILYSPDQNAFPQAWFGVQDGIGSYSAKPLVQDEVDRCTRAVRDELRKVPASIQKRFVSRIYLLQELTYRGVEVGGVNFRQTRTICIDAGPGAPDSYIARMLDHELTHLLTSRRSSGFPFRDWARLNPPGFRYGNGGLEAIRAGLAMGDGDDDCRTQGFSRPYGLSDISEDIACIGEMMFSGDPLFWAAVDRHEILRAKVEMLARYFTTVDPMLNLDLFRLLPVSLFAARSTAYAPGELVNFPDGGKILAPSDPLRIITVPANGAALFPVLSGVHVYTKSTVDDPIAHHTAADTARPDPPPGYQVIMGSDGGWLVYPEGRGLVKSGTKTRLMYREGDTIYFPFGGSIWMPGAETSSIVQKHAFAAYPAGAVVIINPSGQGK